MMLQNFLHFFVFLLMVHFSAVQNKDITPEITANLKQDSVTFTCTPTAECQWRVEDTTTNELSLKYEDDDKSGIYKVGDKSTAVDSDPDDRHILVRFRSCKNCVELNLPSITAIVVGNIFATVLIGWAVYTISAQPRSRIVSGNKASDRVNLHTNGDGDTYQRLNTNDMSEYSGLSGIRKK